MLPVDQLKAEFDDARTVVREAWSEAEVLSALNRAETIALIAMGEVPTVATGLHQDLPEGEVDMKHLILTLCLFTTTSMAQVTRPACYPLVNGYPSLLPAYKSAEVGKHVFWFCDSPKTETLTVEGFSCLHSVCDPVKLSQSIYAITRASARVGTAHAQWDANVSFSCTDVADDQNERGALCRERRAVILETLKDWSTK